MKMDLLEKRSLLKDSEMYHKENLTHEIQYLEFQACQDMRRGNFCTYPKRKTHILIILQPDEQGFIANNLHKLV